MIVGEERSIANSLLLITRLMMRSFALRSFALRLGCEDKVNENAYRVIELKPPVRIGSIP